MKKALLFSFVLFLVIGQGFLFADRKAVDDFMKSYEELVVEAETLAKKSAITVMDMMPLQQKALDFSQKAAIIQTDSAFTPQDALKLSALTTRYTTATEEIQKKL